MRLLIDAGNSRVKWALYATHGLVAEGAVAHDTLFSLAEAWRPYPIREAWGASVAGPEVQAALEAFLTVPVRWVRAAASGCGIVNHYLNPAEQGADRWLAVVAARHLESGDVIVASAGTALTVEALTAEGNYLGGLILPGYRLMLQSLARNTAQLDRPAGQPVPFPQGTEDAIASGVSDAMAGAVERLRLRLARHTGRAPAPVLVTGGDATRLAPSLEKPCRIVDNLVLLGLLNVADAS